MYINIYINVNMHIYMHTYISGILKEDDKISGKWSRLYGILHAVLLLLAGRVASAQYPRYVHVLI
jgi:hypothetical protein